MRKLKPKKRTGPGEAADPARGRIAEKPEGENQTLAVPKEEKPVIKKKTLPETGGEGLVSGFTRKFQFMDQVKLFLRDVKMEMKKVTWPTRKETLAATAMVIILSVLVAFFLGILDVALAKLVSTVLGR
jgi:preprotein translocase subunit SecE